MSFLSLSFRPYLSIRSARLITTTPNAHPNPIPTDEQPKNTHFKITLRRSAISLDKKIKGTLAALGIHRRMQTVYHAHSPEVAGKILKVKELVEVENVPTHAVRTKAEQKRERKPAKGYEVIGSRLNENQVHGGE